METPFFANRLTVGNAVIGAWLKVYSREEVYGIKGRNKLEQNKWWERAPHKIEFYSNRVKRSVNEVYHFLLPDNNMLGVRSIAEQKKANKGANDRMTTILKDWTAPINATDFAILQRISAKIDVLLKDYFTAQISIDKYTNNRKEIWDGIDHSQEISLFKEEERMESYARKQQLFDTRYGHDNAYHKLKLVMDYWCALWFWEYKDADSLPTRAEYWGDIEAMLNVDNDKIDSRTRQALERIGDSSLFDNDTEFNRISEDEAQIVLKTQKEILSEAHAHLSLFADEEPLRFQIAERLADHYHFFHPMLEFIEVFWLRDGFDIICGNPPWIKWTYEPQNIVGNRYPQYVIREEYNADKVERKLKNTDYLNDSALKSECYLEEVETGCLGQLLNSPVLYKELEGSKSDLFKSILFNSLELISSHGKIGMVHPNTIFDEAKGQTFREYIYPRLNYVFQYENRLTLFREVHPEKLYDICVYGNHKEIIDFDAMSNVYHPNMVDSSFVHDGTGYCHGREIVDEEGKKHLNLSGYKDRIIRYDESLLHLIAKVFEGTDEWQSCKLVSIHSERGIEIVKKLADFAHLAQVEPFITVGFDATNSLKDNTVKKETKYPDYEKYEMMFNSTQIGILSPFSKMPQAICLKDSQYDLADYTMLKVTDIIRTNYLPKTDIISFKSQIDQEGRWFSNYKMAFKKMLDVTHERTLKGAIIPPKSSHMNSLISVSFNNNAELIEFAGLSSSVLLDFFLKTVGCKNLTNSVLLGLPFGIDDKYRKALNIRVLRLNCVNNWYKDLWEDMFTEEYCAEEWSQNDSRLSRFDSLEKTFNENVALRSDFERRMALVELDVIAAQALGFTLDDLIFIYVSTFNTTQKYDADTWFDQNGRIVFSVCSEYDLKLPRKGNVKKGVVGWEDIRGNQIDVNTYAGVSPTYTHVIDFSQSEVFRGVQDTFVAPYTRCDRIADYRRA